MDPIHWFIYLYSCIGMYRNGENQKFVYLSWDIFTTDLLPKPILQNNFIKKSAKKQHMEKLKVVLSPYWHDVTTVKKSLESKNSAHSDVNSTWNESHVPLVNLKLETFKILKNYLCLNLQYLQILHQRLAWELFREKK